MKQMKFLIAAVAAASAAFADSSVTWTTDQTGGLVLDGNVTITVPSGTSVTCSGVISGSGKLIKEGAGSLTLSADNTYSGGTQVNAGKLIGTSDNPFGNDHANNPIFVNTDLTDGRAAGTDTSTAIIFKKAGTSADEPQIYGYPITCSEWTKHGARPGSYLNQGNGSSTLYNIALAEDYIKLTNSITGGDISIFCGTMTGSYWRNNPDKKLAPAISGNITAASGGTLALSSRATPYTLSGVVKVGAIYHPISYSYPTEATLSNGKNEIGWYDCGRYISGSGAVTASKAGALNGAVLISTTANFTTAGASSACFSLGNYNQTINYPTIDYFTPRSPADSIGMERHYISCNKTLTMKATSTATNDWRFTCSSKTYLATASLVWDPQGDFWLHNVSRTHYIGGSITVKRGGFSMDENTTFTNITAITVGDGASFVNESTVEKSLKSVSAITLGTGATLSLSNNPFAGSVTVEAGAGTTLNLAEDITVASCKVGDHYLAAKDYSAGIYEGLTISGAGKLYVQTCPGGEETYTWVGGGEDDNITTPGNWQDSNKPDFGNETPTIVFACGTAAVLDCDVSASGIVFDGVSSFELSAQDGYTLSLGAGGISNAPAASASAVTVSAPVMPMIDQMWRMDTNVTFTLSGILKKYGTTPPTITFRQSSFADPMITFVGASTAEDAGDFAGDIVFEETPLAGNKFGTACVRAIGYDPFGPGGTLKIKSKGSGHVSNVRAAELHLSNAVISKAIEFGEYYKMNVYAEDNTTNVVNGAITPFKLGTTSGPFPPNFYVGTNSVLRLCGDINFGTRNNSDTADITLGSTAARAVDMPTGTIAFDGRITRLPRCLQLDSPIRIEFNAPENVITNLNLRYEKNYKSGTSAVVSFGDSYALSNGQALVTFPKYNDKPLNFDLNGTVQHIAGFVANTTSYTPKSSRITSSGAPGVLRVSQSSDVDFQCFVETNVTIQMEGTATLTFTHETAFEAGSTLAVSNGTVAVSNASALNEDVTLKLLGGTISIPAGQTAQVGEAFYLDGNGKLIPLCNGTYGPGDRTIGSFFAPGSGSIRVRKGMSKGLVIIFN